jgi:uncharacterized DUF497 family protein
MLTWDEPKRKLNIKNHGLDFVGCDAIWDHFTVTREDKWQDYGEERLVKRASRDITAKGRKT